MRRVANRVANRVVRSGTRNLFGFFRNQSVRVEGYPLPIATQFLSHVKEGDLETVRKIATKYPQVINHCPRIGDSPFPFSLALKHQHEAIIDYLFHHGASTRLIKEETFPPVGLNSHTTYVRDCVQSNIKEYTGPLKSKLEGRFQLEAEAIKVKYKILSAMSHKNVDINTLAEVLNDPALEKLLHIPVCDGTYSYDSRGLGTYLIRGIPTSLQLVEFIANTLNQLTESNKTELQYKLNGKFDFDFGTNITGISLAK